MKSKIVKNIIQKECEIWQTAHPESKDLLEKFSNKLIFELQYRVKDQVRAGRGNQE